METPLLYLPKQTDGNFNIQHIIEAWNILIWANCLLQVVSAAALGILKFLNNSETDQAKSSTELCHFFYIAQIKILVVGTHENEHPG